jgi:hypothetical protein
MRRTIIPTLLITVASGTSATAGEPDDFPDAPPAQVVEITARGLQFDAPDEIASGWTTFRLVNESAMVHFAIVERLPDDVGLVEQQQEVAPVFQEGMDLLAAGEADAAGEAFGKLPEWYEDIVFMGGPGLVAPGRTAQATVYLEPGRYLLECYVKTDGTFHSYNPAPDVYGMVHELVVRPEPSTGSTPQASVEMTLSNARGIEVDELADAGRYTIAVFFEDQVVHENFVGHDVHLVRLEEGTSLDALAAWMDWRQPAGLDTPAPAEFVGGTNEMPAGETAYFTVDLTPGRYAWISEVPDPAAKRMLKTFTIE